MSNDYLHKVNRYAEDALVQLGAVKRCDHHKDMLLHNPEYEGGPDPYSRALIWLKQHENIVPMREDVQDAIQGFSTERPGTGAQSVPARRIARCLKAPKARSDPLT